MMNAAHLLETALLLLACFLIGATVGALVRVAVLRTGKRATFVETPVESPVAAKLADEAEALVAAPAVRPLSRPQMPKAPELIPVPDFTEIAQVTDVAIEAPVVTAVATDSTAEIMEPPPVMAPARIAGQTTSGRLVASPGSRNEPSRPRPPVDGPLAEVIQFPGPRASEPPKGTDAAEVGTPQFEVPEKAAQAAVNAEPAADAKPSETEREAEAMRAIEGNWRPKRPAAKKPKRRAEVPEGVAGEPEAEPAGRPQGIASPREGGPDDLSQIIGVLPIIETALNRLGLFHFSQVAELTDENVAWIEGHLGIGGRIDREYWREQARELALASAEKARRSRK